MLRWPTLARVAVASLISFRRPRHAPRRAGASAVRAVSRRGRRRRPFVRSARRSVHRHRPLLQIAWRHRCRIIGWGQLAACLAPRLYGALAPSRSSLVCKEEIAMSYSHDSDRSSRPRRGSIPIVRLACACQGRTLRVSTCDSSQRAGDGGLLTLRAGKLPANCSITATH